jgi:hypothetical protein
MFKEGLNYRIMAKTFLSLCFISYFKERMSIKFGIGGAQGRIKFLSLPLNYVEILLIHKWLSYTRITPVLLIRHRSQYNECLMETFFRYGAYLMKFKEENSFRLRVAHVYTVKLRFQQQFCIYIKNTS